MLIDPISHIYHLIFAALHHFHAPEVLLYIMHNYTPIMHNMQAYFEFYTFYA